MMRMERSGDDCNCETLTRGDVSDTGVRPNELGLRIQGIADSHDPSLIESTYFDTCFFFIHHSVIHFDE